MASTAIPEAVFLDAQVFENASFNFKARSFLSFKKHLATGRLRLVITDITVAEVRARIEKNVQNETTAHQKFKKDSRVLRSSSLTDVAGTLVDLDAVGIIGDLQEAFADFLKKSKADIIDTSAHPIGKVFEKYFAAKPPFGSGDKKSEFPDAFVVEAMIDWTKKKNADLFVVSGDKPLVEACEECPELHAKGSLVEVLDHVASDDKKVAEFIRSQLKDGAHVIAKEAKSQFEDLGFYVEDEDGDAEVEVTHTELADEPEIMDITGKEATVQMVFDAQYNAHLSYEDSTTGMWDSEDKVLRFMENRSVTVKGTHDLVIQVQVKFDGMNARKFQVESIDLVEPSDGFGISTPNAQDYE